MRKGAHIKAEKVKPTNFPQVESAEWEEYVEGEVNLKSLPVGYEVKGYLDNTPERGDSLVIRRYERNGTEIDGIMRTSAIKKVIPSKHGTIVLTQNSVYKLTRLS